MTPRIFFITNAYNRRKAMYESMFYERRHFPDARWLVLYNSDEPIDEDRAPHLRFEHREHKDDCFLASTLAIEKFLESDCDVLSFSHDDVVLADVGLFKMALSLLSQFDFVGRYWKERGTNYVMMENFIMTRAAAQQLHNHWTAKASHLLGWKQNAGHEPELTFGYYLAPIDKKHLVEFIYNNRGLNQLGYYHIAYERGTENLEPDALWPYDSFNKPNV